MDVASAMDFDFNSSSYGGNNSYNSAPSSPTRLTEFYCEFDELVISAGATHRSSLAAVPFSWEEKPGVPKGLTDSSVDEDDFSFDVISCQFGREYSVAPAEDLFHGGVIKTVDPTPARKEKRVERERGRERVGFSSSSRLPSSRSRRTRSLSPLGGSDYRREQQQQQQQRQQQQQQLPAVTNTKPSSENGSRKWSFKDLFLFRSASDGRAMDRDPLKKYYSNIFRKHDQDFRHSPESGSTSKRRGRVSAHELHYNLNRAVANDMKKKTYLPYKHGILGGLAFNS